MKKIVDTFSSREQLMGRLENETKVFKDLLVKKAFEAVDRADFVGEDYKVEAYEDYPLPIGFDQTISQPTTVAFMLELLEIKPGNTVLDVGSGSGFSTVLLAKMVGDKGKVVGVEIIPELLALAKKNLAKYKLKNAILHQSEKQKGWSKEGPYDRILVSASAGKIPDELIEQLSAGGIMVLPIKDSIAKVTKDKSGKIKINEFPGFAFVPLV